MFLFAYPAGVTVLRRTIKRYATCFIISSVHVHGRKTGNNYETGCVYVHIWVQIVNYKTGNQRDYWVYTVISLQEIPKK